MLVIVLLIVFILGLWLGEYLRHQSKLNTIPIRIHINGSRGKSSVTRLIAAGLRAGGIKTLAKVTGTLPRIIDENGLEIPIPRPHGVNIIEQLRIVDFMHRRAPQAMVIECMAVLPELQWICEHKIIHATAGVITNCRMDHIREMGPSVENITLSLCNTLPTNGIAFTAEKKMLPLMKKVAAKKRTTLFGTDGDSVSRAELADFNYVEHNDNVALALAVCSHFGVDRETALKGMHQAFPDAGAMKIYKIQSEQGALYFINALAANDPDSTMEIWRKIEDYYPQWNHLTVLLNARSDRYDRSVQLMEMCANGLRFHQLALIGQRLEQVVGIADRARIPRDKLIVIKNSEPEVVYRRIKESIPLDGLSLIFAIGNMGAGGLQVANYFEKMSETENIELQ